MECIVESIQLTEEIDGIVGLVPFDCWLKIKCFKRVGYFITEMACWTAEGRLERSKGGGKGLEKGAFRPTIA
jgi:hypothetical protein